MFGAVCSGIAICRRSRTDRVTNQPYGYVGSPHAKNCLPHTEWASHPATITSGRSRGKRVGHSTSRVASKYCLPSVLCESSRISATLAPSPARFCSVAKTGMPSSRDVEATASWYERALGFEREAYQSPAEPGQRIALKFGRQNLLRRSRRQPRRGRHLLGRPLMIGCSMNVRQQLPAFDQAAPGIFTPDSPLAYSEIEIREAG
jgi:hypothetical protein